MSQQEWLDIFGDNLASILEEEKISQKELSRLTGLSESTISKYINKLHTIINPIFFNIVTPKNVFYIILLS